MPGLDKFKSTGKRKAAPGLVPGVTYRRGSMGEARNIEGIPILDWLTPQHVLALANWLMLAALLLGLFIGFRLLAQTTQVFELRRAVVSRALEHVDRAALTDAVHSLRGSFLSMNLGEAQQRFEEVPWVRRVNLRREFPNRLRLDLEEHVPLARWGEAALLNSEGELFEADYAGALPLFQGPDHTEKTVAEFYAKFKNILRPLGLQPAVVHLSARGAWKLTLNNGLSLELGRDKADERLRTFAAVYPATLAQMPEIKGTIDLRYGNGFALKAAQSKEGWPKREPKQGRHG
jgi:cell division protein FtsQ